MDTAAHESSRGAQHTDPTLIQTPNNEDVWRILTNMKGSRLWSGQGKPRGGMGNERGKNWLASRESIHISACVVQQVLYHRGNPAPHNIAIRIISYDTFCSLASRILLERSALKKYAVRSSETLVTTYPDYAHNDNHVRSMLTKSYTRNVC
jgi:hypothetical protein